MRRITLTIPEPSPSLNEHKWKHWSRQLRLRKHWSLLVMVAKSEARVPQGDPPQAAVVKIIREGKRLLDYDNFVGGAKSLIDSLREHRLIVDDTAEHMTAVFEQRLVTKGSFPRTLVEITVRS